jgi:hypothetical protein
MESSFKHAIGGHKYVAALIAAFERFLQRRSQLKSARGMSVPPIAQYPASSDRQNIYLDPDPPTPHWGC